MSADDSGTKKQLETERSEPSTRKTSFTNLLNIYGRFNVCSLLIAVSSVVVITVITLGECRQCFKQLENQEKTSIQHLPKLKKYWIYGRNVESGYLKNVFLVLERLGYKNDPNATNWDLLWAHDYPFRKLYAQLNDLQKHQRVNHFPGCGYVTNKVDLATSDLKYIPPAFRLPGDKNKLLEYAREFPNASFVQKSNDHRNIFVRKLTEIDLDSQGTFVQEFISKPLLVDGYKFDIGIYTIVTSIDPLRIYIYNGEALLRFCPSKYYPFDPNDLDKYVVGDDYLPIWEVPSLDYFYNKLGFGMKESLNAYLRSKGRNPQKIWEQIEESIRILFLAKEPKLLEVLNKFKSKRNYFEMMRIDFVIDEDLNIYLLEANMSPNLSSAHFAPNQLIYEQVLYNVMGLVGLGQRIQKDSLMKNIPVSMKYSKSASSKIRPWIAKMRLTDLNRFCDHALKYLSWDVLKKSTRKTSFQPVLFFEAWNVFDYLHPMPVYRSDSEERMMVSDKNIVTFAMECESELCRSSCTSPECHLCLTCLSADTKDYLKEAYLEHTNRGDCKRIFPPTMERFGDESGLILEDYSAENQLQYKWFQGKCTMDLSWC